MEESCSFTGIRNTYQNLWTLIILAKPPPRRYANQNIDYARMKPIPQTMLSTQMACWITYLKGFLLWGKIYHCLYKIDYIQFISVQAHLDIYLSFLRVDIKRQ